MDKDQTRLQVFLAHAGIGSRRHCETIIEEGRVSLNGSYLRGKGPFFVSAEDDVRVDGKKVKCKERKVYIALHKPAKYLCSSDDPQGRALALDLVQPFFHQRLYNVGRLDYLTSGLIFFTNDGDFARKITHPSFKIEKEYIVTTKKEIPPDLMESFKKGHYTQGELFRLKNYEISGSRTVRIILEEGKNREIRKVFQSVNIHIKKVHRVRIGDISLKGIGPGRFRVLTDQEISRLLQKKTTKHKPTKYKRGKNGNRN